MNAVIVEDTYNADWILRVQEIHRQRFGTPTDQDLAGAVEKRYNPDQPRDPAGTSTGGQWASTGAGAAQSATVRDRVTAAVAEGLRKQKPEASAEDIERGTEQVVDVMGLDRERFLYYANKFGVADADALADEFFAEAKEAERRRLQERWESELSLTPTGEDGGKYYHAVLSDELYAVAVRDRAEETVDDLAGTLRDRYGVELINSNGTDEGRVYKEVASLLNLADAEPAVAQVLREKTRRIEYRDAYAGSTAAASWLSGSKPTKHGTIFVYPSSFATTPGARQLPPSSWIHELGHGAEGYVDFAEWRAVSDKSERRVSIYAFNTANEDFAETFTMLYGGRAGLAEAWVPERVRFIRERMPWEKNR